MLAVGINSGIYKFLLLLHILSVIVGIGAVMLNGIYAAQAQKRPGPGGRAVSEANFMVSQIAERVIYLIPIFGILLIAVSDKAWKFSQTWIWLSLVLYIAAVGVAHAVMTPGHRRINELLAEMETAPPPAGGAPPQVAEVQQIGQRLAMGGAFLNLAVVALVALMIWKPGV
ncbi:MAG: putative integral rane protein [Actinomycetota bacterium]|nr:putative integral rane protein [Actinomycetota bacterium]